jgi:stage II sporulation protein R
LNIVESALREQGMDYGAQLMIGVYDFPDRQYGDTLYPAGKYEALRVVLGEGQGHNWWCVMFPPLCILELPDGKIDYEEMDADFELSGLKLNSFLLKILKSIDGGKLWQRIQELANTQ